MEMDNSVTDIRHPDPLAAIASSSVGVRNLSSLEKKECVDCVWRYACSGGCPLMTYRISGCYDSKSPNCEIYKKLFPAVVRLEGLRILKYSGYASL